MAKYKLKISCGYFGCDWTADIDSSDKEDELSLERISKHDEMEEDEEMINILLNQAIETSGFEWHLEKVEDE